MSEHRGDDRLGVLVMAVMGVLFLVSMLALAFTDGADLARPVHPAIAPGVTAVPYRVEPAR